MRRLAVLAVLVLAACGVDGPPLRPGAEAVATPGVSVSGTVKVGVAGGSAG